MTTHERRSPMHTLPHVRVSLFGNCNFRCTYCPPWGENSYEIGRNLSTEELLTVLRSLASQGFEVVKLTGGEPTLRRDLVEIVEQCAELFSEVRLITNGWKLAGLATKLRDAGLSLVELSLDAASGPAFDAVTQTTNQFPAVMHGLDQCLAIGLDVQLNMVVMRDNFDEVAPMLDLVDARPPTILKLLELVYYEYPGYEFWRSQFVDVTNVLPLLEARSESLEWLTPPGAFGTPMRLYTFSGGSSVIVKDGAVGAVYADMCLPCPLHPCQDGLYGLSVTNDGSLKMCKHRPDLHVPLARSDDGELLDTDAAVREVVQRYASADFRPGAWQQVADTDHHPAKLVSPTPGVMRWYRGKKGSVSPATEEDVA